MILLAVDTSTAQMGIALSDGNQISAESVWYSHQHHTVELAPAVLELLKHAGMTMKDVDGLVVALGPGSFTSLRVGLAFVKGLALSRNLPLVGIPTLDVLAVAQAVKTLPLAAVLRAGRGRIAVGWYRPADEKGSDSLNAVAGERRWENQGPAEITTAEALAKSIDRPTLVAGELTAEERQRLSRKKVNVVLASAPLCVRRPALLAEMGRERHENRRVDDPASLAPIYLQLTDAVHA